MIGVLVVSHCHKVAEGIARIASEIAGIGRNSVVEGVGGNDDGSLGISVEKVLNALTKMLAMCDGVIILPDIGSSILSSRAAINMLDPKDSERVIIANAPILEGAIFAVVEASAGSDLETVEKTAIDARMLNKTER